MGTQEEQHSMGNPCPQRVLNQAECFWSAEESKNTVKVMKDRDQEIPPSWQCTECPRGSLHHSVLSKILFQKNSVAVAGWNSAVKQNKILLVSDLEVCACTL